MLKVVLLQRYTPSPTYSCAKLVKLCSTSANRQTKGRSEGDIEREQNKHNGERGGETAKKTSDPDN